MFNAKRMGQRGELPGRAKLPLVPRRPAVAGHRQRTLPGRRRRRRRTDRRRVDDHVPLRHSTGNEAVRRRLSLRRSDRRREQPLGNDPLHHDDQPDRRWPVHAARAGGLSGRDQPARPMQANELRFTRQGGDPGHAGRRGAVLLHDRSAHPGARQLRAEWRGRKRLPVSGCRRRGGPGTAHEHVHARSRRLGPDAVRRKLRARAAGRRQRLRQHQVADHRRPGRRDLLVATHRRLQLAAAGDEYPDQHR